MKKNILVLLITLFSCDLLSQSVIATVNSGSHLILTTDWSKFNNVNLMIEKVDGTKSKSYLFSTSRPINPTAMYVDGLQDDFEQGSLVKVYILKPKISGIISNQILATVNSGSHLEKATDWSVYSNKNILVEEVNGMNQNVYKYSSSRPTNPNAMLVTGLENAYGQGTNVYVYIIEDVNFLNNNMGIGTNTPSYKLDVCGTIRAQEVKVDLQGTCVPDFVFKNDYKLMDLNTLEKFVKTNQHLPEISPENEMIENGLNIKEFQMKLLQKMEEMTLYVIEQNKKNEKQEQKIKILEAEIKKIKSTKR
ncbi:hypothetical protein [Flavobacterium reichenbachii]|uniref:hypothetical protein n=1 Tax=Flavobacterium reichenbachii TaxID=362418 RepID=UPI000689F544|nr:hypothetical protein [Flavobacterium reichenbachii]OXB18820.1 hypothetical protein B0A68_02070 [Flavobacterium reichenbachii]